MRPNLHSALHKRLPIMLGICGTLLLLTFILVPFSLVFVGIGIVVGLLDAVISADELTGGKILSVFSMPLLIAGGITAEILTDTHASFGLYTEYMLIVFCVDMAIVLLFRGYSERFVARRRSVS